MAAGAWYRVVLHAGARTGLAGSTAGIEVALRQQPVVEVAAGVGGAALTQFLAL